MSASRFMVPSEDSRDRLAKRFARARQQRFGRLLAERQAPRNFADRQPVDVLQFERLSVTTRQGVESGLYEPVDLLAHRAGFVLVRLRPRETLDAGTRSRLGF